MLFGSSVNLSIVSIVYVCVIACVINGISKSGINSTIRKENFLFIYPPPRICLREFFKVFAKSSSEDEDSRIESLFKMRLLGCSAIREPLIIHYRDVLISAIPNLIHILLKIRIQVFYLNSSSSILVLLLIWNNVSVFLIACSLERPKTIDCSSK